MNNSHCILCDYKKEQTEVKKYRSTESDIQYSLCEFHKQEFENMGIKLEAIK